MEDEKVLRNKAAAEQIKKIKALKLPVADAHYEFMPGDDGDQLIVDFTRPLSKNELEKFEEFYKDVPRFKPSRQQVREDFVG